MSNRFWVVLVGILLAASVVGTLALRRVPADVANVYQDGVLIKSVDLSDVDEPYSFTVECADGMNIVAIENGRIRVVEADCPDGSCVRQGWHSGGASPIVCLPHRLAIVPGRGGASATPIVDAVAG